MFPSHAISRHLSLVLMAVALHIEKNTHVQGSSPLIRTRQMMNRDVWASNPQRIAEGQ